MGRFGRFLAFGSVISLFMLTAVAASGNSSKATALTIPAFYIWPVDGPLRGELDFRERERDVVAI